MFTDKENWEISKQLAAILHMGNLRYEGKGKKILNEMIFYFILVLMREDYSNCEYKRETKYMTGTLSPKVPGEILILYMIKNQISFLYTFFYMHTLP